ncbi:chitin deacetylase 7-like [Littorina saxatilis]|uniref:Chitin-binding type-2 domain-containing protein n=1 Tax=Littorina saxatilis TaxID=31220 RepID=A0AAN9BAD1_9CAEN
MSTRQNQSHHLSNFSIAVLLAVFAASVSANRLGTECGDNGAFYCHDSDPGFFTRCIEHELFLFECPEGLHFNTKSQTCDWPKNADCGRRGGKRRGSTGHLKVNHVMHDDGKKKSDKKPLPKKEGPISASAASSSPISMSAGGKPWWRPEGVDSSAWEDLNGLVEVPFDGSSVSESASVSGKKKAGGSGKSWKKKISSAAEGGKRKGTKSHGHSHAISDTAEKRPDLENVQWHEGPCSPSECKPPNCRCPGTDIPSGLSPKSTPQMVMLTFDDEVSAEYYGYFQRLFRPGRYNPNGCPVRGCLFVSGSGTDYDLVYPMYAMGMEIASHTLSHKFPHTWWATASYQEYIDEVEGMRKELVSQAGIPYEAIKGFRVPFLQVGGDNMYKALYDNKFTYDTSMFTGSVWEGSDPIWPFTLDYTVPEQFCQHKPCPVKQYPGLWEIPVQRWYGVDGISCAMPDGCTASGDAEEDLEFLRSNFKRYYESNRAPLGIFVHARWFHSEHHLDALDRFIDELMSLEDVYIVTPIQVIEWMKNPTPVEEVKSFKPWSCEGSVSRR